MVALRLRSPLALPQASMVVERTAKGIAQHICIQVIQLAIFVEFDELGECRGRGHSLLLTSAHESRPQFFVTVKRCQLFVAPCVAHVKVMYRYYLGKQVKDVCQGIT